MISGQPVLNDTATIADGDENTIGSKKFVMKKVAVCGHSSNCVVIIMFCNVNF